MNWAYVLEVQGKEERDNTPIFQKIIELDLDGEFIAFDMENGRPQVELEKLITKMQPHDTLYIRSVVDLGDSMETALNALSALSERQVTLYSCVEPYLDKLGYLETVQGIMQVLEDFKKKKQKRAYYKAVEGGRVGRPSTFRGKEEVVKLYQQGHLDIKGLMILTGLSKSTIYRYLKGCKRDV